MDAHEDTRRIQILSVSDVGRRRRWTDDEKIRIVEETLRVHIPLTLRNCGGCPRILSHREIEVVMATGHDARLLRAIGRAWDWRRPLERSEANTIAYLAREAGISDRYVSPVIRLAWLSPTVLERLVLRREPTMLSILELRSVAELPWVERPGPVFD